MRYILWILEDDPDCKFVYENIFSFHYELRFFENLSEIKGALRGNADKPDLLIADLRLPDGMFSDLIMDSTLVSNQSFVVISSLEDIDILRFCFDRGPR